MNPERLHKQCLAIMREIGDRLGESYALCNLGPLAKKRGIF